MKLKDQMFSQFATSGLTELLKEFQEKHSPKKGMRFNKSNITYEISVPKVVDANIEYEISSKIPQDEVPDQKKKEAYFKKVKDIMMKEKDKPVSSEMDNIVWNAEKETEKKREYVKLVYRHPFESLYNEKEIITEAEDLRKNPKKKKIPEIPGVMTTVGKMVLVALKENLVQNARHIVEAFIKANEAVKKEIRK